MKENFNLRNEDFIPRQNTPDYTNQNSFLILNNGNSFYGQIMFQNK